METVLYLALMIVSIALIVAVILQSKGSMGGGLFLTDYGSILTGRHGLEKTMFQITVVLSIIFFLLVIITIRVVG